MKTGTELKIAKEIQQFRQKVGENVSYEVDLARFEADKQYMLRKYGANSKEYKEWYEASTEEQYLPAFYEALSLIFGEPTQRLQQLYKRRAQLLAPYKNDNNKENLDDVPESVREKIKALDEAINNSRTGLSKDQYESFNKLAEIVYTDKYYEDADKARAEGRYEEWYEANHYEDARGNMRPISIYTYVRPRSSSFILELQITSIRK